MVERSEIAEKVYRSLYDRFWRITNQSCQINNYAVRGIAHLSLAELGEIDLEPDQAMEVQAALDELRQAGVVRRLSEDEEAALLRYLQEEGQNPREFLETKDYLMYVGPN